MDRRKFLGSMAALGVGGVLTKASGSNSLLTLPDEFLADKTPSARSRGRFDENLVVIISDLHTNPEGYQPDRLRRTISDILAMRPLPLNVLALGDLAYLTGKPSEYALLKEIIVPLEKSGIHLTMAMGNHDRRKEFADAFPQYAAASQLTDRFVFVVETPRADFILLDSLQESEDPTTWITPGALDEPQVEWLKKTAATRSKPFFVMAHHNLNETKIKDILIDNPWCSGYINGHHHIWDPGWTRKNYSQTDIFRTLCVPSTGHWGDIGYTEMRLGKDRAEAILHEYEFFFPRPLEAGEVKPGEWDMIMEENKGAKCCFAYHKG